MPTNYTGNQGATQAPSGRPRSDANPIVVIPIDGEPENVASFTQALEVLADYAAWLTKPRAISTSFAEPIIRHRSAAGHTRGFIDHFGFPNGRIVQWDETWPGAIGFNTISGVQGPFGIDGPRAFSSNAALDALTLARTALQSAGAAANFAAAQPFLIGAGDGIRDALIASAADGPIPGPWRIKTNLTTFAVGVSRVGFFGPDATTPLHRWVGMEAGDTAGDYAELYRQTQMSYSNDLAFALDWEMYVGAVNIPGRHVFVGMGEESYIPTPGPGPSQNYALFELGPTGNWLCSCAGAGVAGGANSGVAAVVGWHRFRIEFHGANVAEDGVRALRYYIDGALVATVIANIPVVGSFSGAHMSILNTGGGSSGLTFPMRPGPMRYRSNIYPTDVI